MELQLMKPNTELSTMIRVKDRNDLEYLCPFEVVRDRDILHEDVLQVRCIPVPRTK